MLLLLAASVNAPDIGRREADGEDAVVSRRGVKDIRMTAVCDGNQTVEINVRLAGTRFPGIEKVIWINFFPQFLSHILKLPNRP